VSLLNAAVTIRHAAHWNIIELHDEVEEFENLLHFRKETEFVRYVTKYNKDVTNLISYFNIKINGYLSQRITEFKSRHA